jgi:hypothetical protein
MNIPAEIAPDNPNHRARVDACREHCFISADITSPVLCGNSWSPHIREEAYAIASALWRVDENGRVPVSYETHADMFWVVQSYYRTLWETLERAPRVSEAPREDQLDALTGAYLAEIWVRAGGARVLTV